MGIMRKIVGLGGKAVEKLQRKPKKPEKPEDNTIESLRSATRDKSKGVFRDKFQNSPENAELRKRLLEHLRKDYDELCEKILKRNVKKIPRWEDIQALFTPAVLDKVNGSDEFYNPKLLIFPHDGSHGVWTVSIVHSEKGKMFLCFSADVKGSKT